MTHSLCLSRYFIYGYAKFSCFFVEKDEHLVGICRTPDAALVASVTTRPAKACQGLAAFFIETKAFSSKPLAGMVSNLGLGNCWHGTCSVNMF